MSVHGKCLENTRTNRLLPGLVLLMALVLLFCAPFACFPQERREVPQIHGSAESTLQLSYETSPDRYNLEIPLITSVKLTYETEKVESVFSVDYLEELGVGETYVRGGTEYSHMKFGYYVVDWGIGYSISPLGGVNSIDSRYPENIFYWKQYAPYPSFMMTIGNSSIYNQLFIAQRDEHARSVDEGDLGIRGVVHSNDATVCLGFLRKFGTPPPIFFLTAKNSGEREEAWMELNWEYNKEGRDVWTFLLGLKQQFSRSTFYAEYIVERSDNFFFLQQAMMPNPSTQLSIRCFFHIPEFSSALNGFVALAVDKTLTFEPGFYLFIGKPEGFFSPLRTGNDNSLYMKISFEF